MMLKHQLGTSFCRTLASMMRLLKLATLSACAISRVASRPLPASLRERGICGVLVPDSRFSPSVQLDIIGCSERAPRNLWPKVSTEGISFFFAALTIFCPFLQTWQEHNQLATIASLFLQRRPLTHNGGISQALVAAYVSVPEAAGILADGDEDEKVCVWLGPATRPRWLTAFSRFRL